MDETKDEKKLKILDYISNLNSVKFNLQLLNSGNLKDWEKKELYRHIFAILTERGISCDEKFIEEKLSTLDNKNTLSSFEKSDILLVLKSKL